MVSNARFRVTKNGFSTFKRFLLLSLFQVAKYLFLALKDNLALYSEHSYKS